MRTLITVPMKAPSASKTRLAASLDDKARARFARLLYHRTLRFLAPIAAQTGADLAVVTGSESAADIARGQGVAVIREGPASGLSAALAQAATWALAKGYGRLCVIPADLAAPLDRDVLRLLESPAPVTICPAVDMGTNALLVTPPDALRFCFGPRSALRHREQAEARGLHPVMMPLESLSFDVDTTGGLRRAIDEVPDIARICG